MTQPVAVYIHIPYCLAKCHYCNFSSRPLQSSSELANYLSVVQSEISNRLNGETIATIFLGGGTPSLCDPELLAGIFRALNQHGRVLPQAEISLEVNPATVSTEKLKGFKDLGFNRISIGVQSTSDEYLKKIGRLHTWADSQNAFILARKSGFTNVSCDLIYGLPGQTLDELKNELHQLLQMEPEHLSFYALSVEPGTPLADNIQCHRLPEVDEDISADMFEGGRKIFADAGYHQYEISNYARLGFECEHNNFYWKNKPYLGFGASAHSFDLNRRYWNFSDPDKYIKAVVEKQQAIAGSEVLQGREKIAETLIVGLRLTKGINFQEYDLWFGADWKQPFSSAFEKFLANGLLVSTPEGLGLSEKGMILSNCVFRELV